MITSASKKNFIIYFVAVNCTKKNNISNNKTHCLRWNWRKLEFIAVDSSLEEISWPMQPSLMLHSGVARWVGEEISPFFGGKLAQITPPLPKFWLRYWLLRNSKRFPLMENSCSGKTIFFHQIRYLFEIWLKIKRNKMTRLQIAFNTPQHKMLSLVDSTENITL